MTELVEQTASKPEEYLTLTDLMDMFEARRGIKLGETMRLLHACTHRSDFLVKEYNRKINRVLHDAILFVLDTLDDAGVGELSLVIKNPLAQEWSREKCDLDYQ